jgi:hypothetical protein
MALFALFLHAALPRSGSALRHHLAVGTLSCAAAVAIEILQPLVDRTASVADLLSGVAGVVAALTGLQVWRTGGGSRLRWGHGLLTLVAVLLVVHPVWAEWRALSWRNAHFPVLGDFEDDVELRLWKPVNGGDPTRASILLTTERASHGGGALEVRRGSGVWSGARYLAGRSNWRPYDELVCDVYNPSTPFPLMVRVDDDGDCTEHDSRFNLRVTVENGWNEIRIPITQIENGPKQRLLDTGSIKRLLLFGRVEHLPGAFLIDHVRLTGGHDP